MRRASFDFLSPTGYSRWCDRSSRDRDLLRWLRTLHDPTAKAKVAARVRRLAFGNPGDVRPVGEELSELRIQYGPGYRVYYVQRATVLIILLCGGDKKTQVGD